MNNVANNFIENIAQCWGCDVFDNLFRVVSNAGAVVYTKVSNICFAIFAVLFVFYVVWAVWKTLNPKKPDVSDKLYTKTVGRVVINSLFALTLLGLGIAVPRVDPPDPIFILRPVTKASHLILNASSTSKTAPCATQFLT